MRVSRYRRGEPTRPWAWWLLLAGLLVGPAVAAGGPGPTGVVEALHGSLLEIMRGGAIMGFAGRRQHIEPVVDRSFDLGFIARVAMGRHWKGLDGNQRRRMTAAFRDMTVSTYAARFDGFGGQRFETLGERPLKRGRVLVRTRLVDAGGDEVSLDYVLQPAEGSWRIVNVVADGVSDLSLKRADYASVMNSEGFESLVERLVEQAARFGRESG